MKLFSSYKNAFSECNNCNLKIFAFTHSFSLRTDLNFGRKKKMKEKFCKWQYMLIFSSTKKEKNMKCTNI